MAERKFEIGKLVVTDGVSDFLERENTAVEHVVNLVLRHQGGDWGNVPDEDALLNDEALNSKDRIMSSYLLHGESIWIITEADRNLTTVLFPGEY